ncbi:hypothetical protein Bbelb_048720 [Branchiostoma belcheri]|nr:hypothetical protein Bbelb_048720 [Branchiostoma belcheri]
MKYNQLKTFLSDNKYPDGIKDKSSFRRAAKGFILKVQGKSEDVKDFASKVRAVCDDIFNVPEMVGNSTVGMGKDLGKLDGAKVDAIVDFMAVIEGVDQVSKKFRKDVCHWINEKCKIFPGSPMTTTQLSQGFRRFTVASVQFKSSGYHGDRHSWRHPPARTIVPAPNSRDARTSPKPRYAPLSD